jgi:hypothetical protein
MFNSKKINMGLKIQLLEAVKSGFPDFDEETDTFVIYFSGGWGSFDSFQFVEIMRHDDWGFKFEGSFDASENEDLLFEILEESGAEYNWNRGGTTGTIKYQEEPDSGELIVETVTKFESNGEVDD